MKWPIACWSDACPKKIILFKHSDLIERTKRSAKAFKFGVPPLGGLDVAASAVTVLAEARMRSPANL